MYQPAHFNEDRLPVLHQLINDHPLGTLVTMTADGLNANHIPFMIDATRGEFGTLCAHVARSNDVWKTFSADVEALVVFQGADAYVSPAFYPSKQEHGKVVPTWDYAVVHAYGPLVIRDDAQWLHAFLHRLTDRHEAARANPWRVGDAPSDFIETMVRAVVGIEIPLTKLIGKWKVSQNRSREDREGVVAGLAVQDSDAERAMAKLVAS